MTQEHTVGPWQYGGPVHRDAPAVKEFPSMPAEYWEIGSALVAHDTAPAIACAGHESDARFIVQAVNAHDELLEALKRVELLIRLAEFPSDEWIAAGRQLARLGPQVRDAIAQASLEAVWE